ncbi:MAG: hypothetical protein AAGF23_18235 [Acidobacteriota bacterium]
MSAVHIHLLSVHLPVAGVLFALVLVAVGHFRRSDTVLAVAYGLVIASAAVAAVAYYSGPTAAEQLRVPLAGDEAWVEQHAAVSRAFFAAVVVTAVLCLQAMLQFAQGDAPPTWLRRLISIAVVACVYLAAWSAHLGGAIRHREIRQPEWIVFPHLDVAGQSVDGGEAAPVDKAPDSQPG